MSLKLTKAEQATLDEIKSATTSETGFMYVDEKKVKKLETAGLVEMNREMSENGLFACRATQVAFEGESKTASPSMFDDSNNQADSAAPAPVSNTASSFVIEDNIPVPKSKPRGKKASKYPFDALGVGQSFFVAPSEDHPEPWKSLSSTVSSANNRYTEEIPGETRVNRKGVEVPATKQLRKFELHMGEKDGVKGARIFRVL